MHTYHMLSINQSIPVSSDGNPAERRTYRVLQILALPAETISIRACALNARAHGHRKRDARVEQPGCERGFAQPRTPRNSGFCGVDLWDGEGEGVEDAVGGPCPCC